MRRMNARTAMVASVMAALACLILTVWLTAQHTWWALLPALLSVWFGVDSWRAWGWSQPED
ncbi:hypothetical protein [Deinococcus sonorensis]|uniref:Phosphatidate cytidylyltransferase n=2 Tax=Deinococcus sonorensis TaxID=309891 RepID=A0AAU7UDB7_9DEIO